MGVKRYFEEDEFSGYPLKLSKQFEQDRKITCREDDFPLSVKLSPETHFPGAVKDDFYMLQSDREANKCHAYGAPVANNELDTTFILSLASSGSEDNMGVEDVTFGSYFPADFDFSIPQRPPRHFENLFSSLFSFSPRKEIPVGPDYQAEVLPWVVSSSEKDCLGYSIDVDNCTEKRPTGSCIVQMPHASYTKSSFLSCPRKEVPIGPNHQAEVPKWDMNFTGKDYVGSHIQGKILVGTCIIPMPDNSIIDGARVGQGRTHCDCLDLGSIKCVAQHVKEAREALLATLEDEKYADLGFCDMGEEVACKWTADEQHLFHEIIFSNPMSLGRNFWKHLSAAFPNRTKKEIVSFYFNVFTLQRRAIQNRSFMLDVDSDDDEWKGAFGNFYHDQAPVIEDEDSNDDDCDDEDSNDDDCDDEEQGAYANLPDGRSNSLSVDGSDDDYDHGRASPLAKLYQIPREIKNPKSESCDNQLLPVGTRDE